MRGSLINLLIQNRTLLFSITSLTHCQLFCMGSGY